MKIELQICFNNLHEHRRMYSMNEMPAVVWYCPDAQFVWTEPWLNRSFSLTFRFGENGVNFDWL